MEPQARIHSLSEVMACAQVYVVDSSSGWSAGALATSEMMRQSHERALDSGQDAFVLGWMAGQAVQMAQSAVTPTPLSRGENDGASLQTALKLAIAFVAARPESARLLRDGGALTGVWLVLMYRFNIDGESALVQRCVYMPNEQRQSILTREQIRAWAVQVVQTDLVDTHSPVFGVFQREGMPHLCAQMLQL